MLEHRPKIGLHDPPWTKMPDPDQEMRWEVEFENVSFAYPSRPAARVLDRISFRARAGELLGIMGDTGAGNT